MRNKQKHISKNMDSLVGGIIWYGTFYTIATIVSMCIPIK